MNKQKQSFFFLQRKINIRIYPINIFYHPLRKMSKLFLKKIIYGIYGVLAPDHQFFFFFFFFYFPIKKCLFAKSVSLSLRTGKNARGAEIRVSVRGTVVQLCQFCRKLRRGQTCKWRCLRAGVKLASSPLSSFQMAVPFRF